MGAAAVSVFADRRTFRQIGGPRAYVRQVAWSLWWRVHLRSAGKEIEPIPCAVPGDLRGAAERRLGKSDSKPRPQ